MFFDLPGAVGVKSTLNDPDPISTILVITSFPFEAGKGKKNFVAQMHSNEREVGIILN